MIAQTEQYFSKETIHLAGFPSRYIHLRHSLFSYIIILTPPTRKDCLTYQKNRLSRMWILIMLLLSLSLALAGLALTYALQTLDSTQYGVRLASEVENLMTSVERVMAYTEIEPEPGYSTETRPSVPWPNAGSLTVQDLSLVYVKGGPRVLQDISFCVCSKEKVGVVGRTGAGKSSLLSALFRMPEPLGKVSKAVDKQSCKKTHVCKSRQLALTCFWPLLTGLATTCVHFDQT